MIFAKKTIRSGLVFQEGWLDPDEREKFSNYKRAFGGAFGLYAGTSGFLDP